MNYLVVLNIAHRDSPLEVIDADTGEVLATRTIHNTPADSLYAQRNRLFEALSCEPDTLTVETKTTDWR